MAAGQSRLGLRRGLLIALKDMSYVKGAFSGLQWRLKLGYM